jgi:hypothetical protein
MVGSKAAGDRPWSGSAKPVIQRPLTGDRLVSTILCWPRNLARSAGLLFDN